ncbi:MAG: zinc ribbon domain-containing protein [Thermoplasmata archaeon]|nr:zinc ribbon domain-containing protein [Thermoplasmata archaeon]
MFVGFLAAGFVGASAPGATGTLAAPGHFHAHPLLLAPLASRGDLVVGAANSPLILTPATVGANTYYQEGNVTVLSGGTLIVRNLTFSVVQYVGIEGTAANRLSHLYTVSIQGKATFDHSVLTTDVQVINAYPKLNLNVTGGGSLTLKDSAFQFPGSVTVTGAGSMLVLNGSAITGNPALQTPSYLWNRTVLANSVFAPTVTIAAGAHALLGQSALLQTYKDNTSVSGVPQPATPILFNTTAQTVTNARWASFGHLVLPPDPENLTKADLYPTIAGGSIILDYGTAVGTSAPVTLNYGASNFPIGTANFPMAGAEVVLPLPPATVQGINALGWTAFLQATGSFGGTSLVNIDVGTTGSATPVNLTYAQLVTVPAISSNITVTGAGSILTAADSFFDLNFNRSSLTPWGSSKLEITNGATAFLANLSLSSPWTAVYLNDSAVMPDASSTAVFYRWEQVPVAASAGIPIPGAQASAFYANNAIQLNNATATAYNNLGSADPDLATYVTAWDKLDHVSGYGISDFHGNSNLLLASSVLTGPGLPDGTYLGTYHIAVDVAALTSNATQWVYASTTPYPASMAPATPDVTPAFSYPGYLASIGVGQVTVSAAGQLTGSASVAIGQTLTVSAVITNTGTASVAAYTANLSYKLAAPLQPKPVAATLSFNALAPGHSQSVNLSWLVNESVTGDHGKFLANFLLTATWNGGVGPNAGIVDLLVPVTILPAPISVTLTPPGTQFEVGHDYFAPGTVNFAGRGGAYINVTAIGPGGSFLLNTFQTPNGTFEAGVSPLPTMGPGTYTLIVSAEYNTVTAYDNFTNAYTIPGASSSQGPLSFLTNTLLGLPIWLLLVIAAIGVGAVLAALFVLGRSAKGKLVECGECGELIPENATVCPKCGAEFESDLVRCSRCSSTIPANSKVCPECSAQLLGKAEGAGADPEQQGYADFIERYRIDARKELGDNYSEGAFWDWWKRQATYVSFSQWRLQQGQGTRSGMSAPPGGDSDDVPVISPPAPSPPPRRGGGAGGVTAGPAQTPAPTSARPSSTAARTAAPVGRAPPTAAPTTPPAATAPPPSAVAPSAGGAAMKACSNCGKEIPPDYLVCPFCGAVTR